MSKANGRMVLSAGFTSAVGTAYLIILFAAGLLTNFVPMGTTNTGTVLLYSLACLLSFVSLLYLFDPLPKDVAVAVVITLALSCLVLVKAGLDSNPVSQRVQELAIFFLGAWPFLFFLQMRTASLRQPLLTTLERGLLGLCAFAIFQSVFADSLPLSMFVLRGDNTFSVDDNQIFRPTGLTGNPIIFSSILVFASAYFAALWFEKSKFRFLLALVCSLVANYVTYTRASIILVIPVLVLVLLLHKRFRLKRKIATLVAIVLATVGAQYLFANGANLVMIQRLQNSDPSSIGSTLEHFAQISNARDAIASHPWGGLGVGSQGNFVGPENVIVTDGAWWILLLEFGVPLSILIVISLCIILIPLVKYVLHPKSKNRALAIATLAFHAYVIPANFINSALLGHISYGLYWVVLGLSVAGIGRNAASNPRPTEVCLPSFTNPGNIS